MKNVLRSTFGPLVVAAFLAITPPMYARGGHGGGHGGHGGGHGGHAARGRAAHAKGGYHVARAPHGGRVFHAGRAHRAGRGYYAARGAGRYYAGRAHNWNGGG